MIKNDIKLFTVENVIKILDKKRHVFFNNNKYPYDLNIIGIRNDDTNIQHDNFDDTLMIVYNDNGEFIVDYFDITTDPSTQYLYVKPINKIGTAIVMPGQYSGVWKTGLHKNNKEHRALVQRRPISVSRDFNKNKNLDYKRPPYTKRIEKKELNSNVIYEYYNQNELVFVEHIGFFGINLHRAASNGITNNVGYHSAGCQVFKDADDHERFFKNYIDKALWYFKDSFTYTLLLKSDFINL